MFKQAIKKLFHKVKEESLEVVKDSAAQVAKTISPGEMLKQATGTQTSEFADYLKNISPENLTPEQLEQRKKMQSQKDEEEAQKLRSFLQATPAHLRVAQKPSGPSAYEATIQDEEKKKAQQAEAQKKQPLVSPTSKQARGMLGAKKKQKTSGFEMGKDKKSG